MSIFERIYMTMATLQGRREQGDKGAAMVEYALLVAGIAVVVSVAAVALGGKVSTMFNGLSF